jgi:F-type H+-transporting ATPase subunit gamma
MANRRVLIKRRKAVRNIRKITRTMQLIATARFQAAMSRATASKPYTQKLAELVRDLTRAAERVDHPLMRPREGVNKTALIVLTSMRGLCGGYNANVLRTAIAHLDEQRGKGIETDLTVVGKKGVVYFRFLKRPMSQQITNLGETPRYDRVMPLADELMERFKKGEIAAADVAYMRFHSAGKQRPEVIRLLPLTTDVPHDEGHVAEKAGPRPQYEFSPEPQALLDELLPATVRVRLFQAFNDAAVSEQVARMVAMKAATDAAGDMITALTRKYNRARQTQITMELLDIVGGANALA